ncbi:P-loop containing nucleoside triphosphate hydrolases superfamily protein [Actinidia rufa]|uniref:P-loop containing nucleoside triphosphate hydrolases superfamily protein n=1 Tax=Actinidia rufa TaxID=165716 RepID=A0A7J0DFF4_9ERIC|nr:P-loop containing nucleoside triphosphate hydrolases superfamily protein [Actinidia rufa]
MGKVEDEQSLSTNSQSKMLRIRVGLFVASLRPGSVTGLGHLPLCSLFHVSIRWTNVNDSCRLSIWVQLTFAPLERKRQAMGPLDYLEETVGKGKPWIRPSVKVRQKYKLENPKSFHYLNQSNCYELDGVNDAHEYLGTRRAMNIIGISEEE